MKKYSIRLCQMHDRDLITFIGTHDFSLTKAVYCALSAFVKGEVFVIDIPPRMEKPVIMKKRVYCRQLVLNEEKDAQLIAFLQKITPGFRNNFFKNLLRLYLCTPISEAFLVDPDEIDDFEKRFEIFKQGKRHVKAAQIKRHQKEKSKIELSIDRREQPSAKEAKPLPPFQQFQEPEEETETNKDGMDDDSLTDMLSSIIQ